MTVPLNQETLRPDEKKRISAEKMWQGFGLTFLVLFVATAVLNLLYAREAADTRQVIQERERQILQLEAEIEALEANR